MFDIGFLELVVCAVVALIVLGPERLPTAARTLGRWVGRARRMVRNLTDEVDRQLKAEELRERIRQERSAVGLEEIQQSVRSALDEARQFDQYLVPDVPPAQVPAPVPATATLPGDSAQPAPTEHPACPQSITKNP